MSADESWAWVRDLVRSAIPLDGGSVLLIGGSLARGWGNPLSDVDAYVLGGTTEPLGPTHLQGGPRPVDVHVVGAGQLAEVLGKVSWERAQSGENLTDSLSVDDWLLLERIHHPIVLQGAEQLAALQQQLRSSAFGYLAVAEHFTYADSFAEDCLGQVAVDDLRSAVLSGQAAVLRAVDGLLCSLGCYSLNPKWRARAFADAAPAQMSFPEYWSFQCMTGLTEENHRQWALDAVTVARRVMTDVELPDVA